MQLLQYFGANVKVKYVSLHYNKPLNFVDWQVSFPKTYKNDKKSHTNFRQRTKNTKYLQFLLKFPYYLWKKFFDEFLGIWKSTLAHF